MPITHPAKSVFLMLLILGVALMPNRSGSAEDADNSANYQPSKLFTDALAIIRKNYVRDVSEKELIQGALSGMLQSLDSLSSFITEDMLKELQEEATAKVGVPGIEMSSENGVLSVVSPIEDTPAFRAGLKPGDKILKINGESTKNIPVQKAVRLMRGPKGSKITITIMREGFRRPKDYTITRDIIRVHSVKKEQLEPGYPYVRIVNFSEKTHADLEAAIKDLGGDETIRGLIVDLRNNPSGLLDEAVKVANLFVDKGLIVYTDGRSKDQRVEFRAGSSAKHHKFRIAVLVNEGSASASEIVAGALQDHDRAVIFGTKSFGKASVQTVMPLDNGTGLRLTTAYYYTPKGRQIQKSGILPDVDMKAEVKKLEEEERKKESRADKKKVSNPKVAKKTDLENDPVVKKALEWLKSDVTVMQFKMDSEEPIQDTAWYTK